MPTTDPILDFDEKRLPPLVDAEFADVRSRLDATFIGPAAKCLRLAEP
jgi:hypothetical protein